MGKGHPIFGNGFTATSRLVSRGELLGAVWGVVERFFNKLKHFRAIATRFEKHDANYLTLVKLAAS